MIHMWDYNKQRNVHVGAEARRSLRYEIFQIRSLDALTGTKNVLILLLIYSILLKGSNNHFYILILERKRKSIVSLNIVHDDLFNFSYNA